LRRVGVVLFPNRRGRATQRWSHHAIWDGWKRAYEAAGVRYVSAYKLTHSTATELAKTNSPRMLAAFLRHADPRSSDPYIVLAGEAKGLKRDED